MSPCQLPVLSCVFSKQGVPLLRLKTYLIMNKHTYTARSIFRARQKRDSYHNRAREEGLRMDESSSSGTAISDDYVDMFSDFPEVYTQICFLQTQQAPLPPPQVLTQSLPSINADRSQKPVPGGTTCSSKSGTRIAPL